MAKRRGNHEGSISQRSNGTWRALVTLNGKRLSFTGKTQKECRDWIRETQHQIKDGLDFFGAKTMYQDFLENWLISVQSSIRSKTHHQYAQLVRDYITPRLGKIKLNELRPDHIQALYNKEIKEGRGLRTVQLIHAVIHRSLNHAVKLGVISRNPASATTPPKPKHREMQIYNQKQVQQLLITAKGNDDRFFALYQLAVSTGMRQGELLGLKWQDIDLDRRVINVKRQLKPKIGGGFQFSQPKTKSGIRKVLIGDVTKQILVEHKAFLFKEMQCAGETWQENDLVFPTTKGTPVNQRNLTRRYKKLLIDAGLPEIRFHDLRHTAASLMLNHGIPILIVSRRLGHSKPSITLDVYGHLIPSMQEQAAQIMDELITPVGWESFVPIAPELHQEANMLQNLTKTNPHLWTKT